MILSTFPVSTVSSVFISWPRDGLFRALLKTECPPSLLSVIRLFHTDMKGVVQFDGSSSKAFGIRRGIKQSCLLAPTLFGIFFAIMLRQGFEDSTDTRPDGKLINLSRLRANTEVFHNYRDLLLVNDAVPQFPTDQKACNCWTTSPMHVKIFNWLSTWKNTNVFRQIIDDCLPLYLPWLNSDWQSLLGYQDQQEDFAQQHVLLSWPKRCGRTAGWPTRLTSLCTEPASSARHYTTAKPALQLR